MNERIQKLTIAGMLIAVGIIIPMFSPLKIVLEPASFTLGSHIAVFIAMFISPAVAIAVAIGTTLGFFLGSFPIVIVLRAASHIVFAVLGALYLRKTPATVTSLSYGRLALYSFFIALIHAFCELIVVSVFYFAGGMGSASGGALGTSYYDQGFLMSVLLLVGLGTVVHSMVDFAAAYLIMLPLRSATKGRIS